VRLRPALWAPLALAAWVLVAAGKLPVVDEESYLDIGRQLAGAMGDPYGWWRRWQPWGADPAGDVYLYAHPPLHLWWVALCEQITGSLWGQRLLAALPPAVVLGASGGAVAERVLSRPGLLVLWLGAPVVVLAAQSGLMIDLGAAALTTAAAAAWLRQGRAGALAAGALLGLAGGWKYPSLVLWVAIGADAWRRGRWGALALAAGAFAAVWGGLEGWLALRYGRVHLLHVLATAPQIDRGPLGGRALGVLLRLGLLASPLLLLGLRGRWPRALAGAAIGAGGSIGLVDGAGGLALAGLLGAGGGLALGAAGGGARRGGDEGFLGVWALAVVAGVALGHNYASTRYLLPAALPLALLLARGLERAGAVRVGWAVAGAWGALGLALGYAEQRQAAATEALVAEVAERYPPGRFTGEWTARWALSRAGWEFWVAGEPLAPGQLFVAPRHASPAAPPEGLEEVEVLESSDRFPLRVIDLERGVGYHAETLGMLPLGWARDPLEAMTISRAR
jgi:hypothetical protein